MFLLIVVGGPGFPAIGQMAILMAAILAVVIILNFLYDFLKKRLARKNPPQPPALTTDAPRHLHI
jgi:hypothetical protein